jgi:hypothetical protein
MDRHRDSDGTVGMMDVEIGFREALRRWRCGDVDLRHTSTGHNAHAVGMTACLEALNGWLDSSRSILRKAGMTGKAAEELVQLTRLPENGDVVRGYELLAMERLGRSS